MNEIERAVKTLTHYKRLTHNPDELRDIETALTVLRAELARQDAKPLTCDGCEHIKEKYAEYGGVTLCCNCSRGTILPDRYKPKGETV